MVRPWAVSEERAGAQELGKVVLRGPSSNPTPHHQLLFIARCPPLPLTPHPANLIHLRLFIQSTSQVIFSTIHQVSMVTPILQVRNRLSEARVSPGRSKWYPNSSTTSSTTFPSLFSQGPSYILGLGCDSFLFTPLI